MRDVLRDYENSRAGILAYFDLKDYWGLPQIDDRTNMFWSMFGEGDSARVLYHPAPFDQDMLREYWQFAEEFVFNDRLNPIVVRRDRYTAVMVQTDISGLFLAIFDNSKEITGLHFP